VQFLQDEVPQRGRRPVNIYIPTYLRAHAQPFYMQCVRAGFEPLLLVDKTDPQDYSQYFHRRIAVRGIAQKREWIARHADGIHVVADDDLLLLRVTREGRTLPATPADVRECMARITKLARHYPHGAVHRRAFVNSAAHLNYKVNTGGYGSLLFYNKDLWKRKPVFRVHGIPEALEDLCSQLALFKQGLPFVILTTHATKEVHEKDHYQTGAWATETKRNKDRTEILLMGYWKPVMKQGARREIIDWRATRSEWSVPEHLGSRPTLRQNR
jgi:hypothetical protein